MRSLLLVFCLSSALTGCGYLPALPGGEEELPPPVVAPAPVAPPAPVAVKVPVIKCASEGAVTYVAEDKILYYTTPDGGVYIEDLTPGDNGQCVSKAGNKVEVTCVSEGGPCASDIKVTTVTTGKTVGHSPSKLCDGAEAQASKKIDVPVEGLQADLIRLGKNLSGVKRTVTKLTRSDSKQNAALAAVCAGSDAPGCAPYKVGTATPVPEEATVGRNGATAGDGRQADRAGALGAGRNR